MSSRKQETSHDARASLEAEMMAWRTAHPTATFTEIEQVLDTHLARIRAELLDAVAHASPAADWRGLPPEQHPVCPECGTHLQPRGTHRRRFRTQGNQQVTLERSYGICPACGTGVFPPR